MQTGKPTSRGVERLTSAGHVRRGQCSLCPTFGLRTLTHVPPHCAGNDGDASFLCKTTDDAGVIQFVKGREKPGGSRFYSQCAACNGLVSRYDGEWPLWVKEMMTWLDSGNRRVPDAGFPFILPGTSTRGVRPLGHGRDVRTDPNASRCRAGPKLRKPSERARPLITLMT